MGPTLVTIGSAPRGEPTITEGAPDWEMVNRLECRVFRDALLRGVGPEPPGCYLTIRGGRVVVIVEEETPETQQYVQNLESARTTWDGRALKHLFRGLQRMDLLEWDLSNEEHVDAVRRWYARRG